MKPSITIFLAVSAGFAEVTSQLDFSKCLQLCKRPFAFNVYGPPCYRNDERPLAGAEHELSMQGNPQLQHDAPFRVQTWQAMYSRGDCVFGYARVRSCIFCEARDAFPELLCLGLATRNALFSIHRGWS